jgi:hypothetical protein
MRLVLFVIISCLSQISFAQDSLSVFFIGNSYTGVNNLPSLIGQMASSKGNHLSYYAHIPGGSTFMQHSTNANVSNQLNQETWDYVVLQEQSQIPSFSPIQVASDCYPYAENLCTQISESNNCVEPVFFMTWGRENGDQQNCQSYPPICTYEGMQERLSESYTEMAEDNEALLSPVGIAWKNIRAAHPTIDLYGGDGSHPSIHGSYLASCVFYSLLFNDSPSNGFVPSAINQATAEVIQTFAYNAVLNTETDFTNAISAEASYELIGDSLFFYNETLDADLVNWTGITQNILSFDDTLAVFIGDYQDIYQIQLFVSDACSDDILLFEITDLEIEEDKSTLVIYPNPSSGILHFNTDEAIIQSLNIYNNIGSSVFRKTIKGENQIDLSQLSEGIYLLVFECENGAFIKQKWLKKN